MRDWLRSWRLLSLRSAVVLLFVLYTLCGFLVVPLVARNLIVDNVRDLTGREATLEDVDCNPFALSMTLRGFSIPDRDGSVLLSFDTLHVNAQASSLFRWATTLKELRVENPHIGLRRFADGKINVLELTDEVEKRTAPASEPAEPEEAGGLPRALLQHILVTGATVEIEDYHREEPLRLLYGPSVLELNDIGTLPDSRGGNEFVIGLSSGSKIRIDGDVEVVPLGLEGTVSIEGTMVLGAAWPLLEPYFEFDVVGGAAAGHFRYNVHVQDDGLHARIDDLDYELEGLALAPRDSDVNVLELDSLTIEDGHFAWPEGDVGAAGVTASGARAFAWLEPDGSFGWAALVPEPTQEQVVETYVKVEEAVAWKAVVDRFEVRGASAVLEDRTFDTPLRLEANEANLVVTGITTEPDSSWGVTAAVTLPGQAAASAQGRFGIAPVHVEAKVDLQGLDLSAAEPYVVRFLPLDLVSGFLDTTGSIDVNLHPDDEGPMAGFNGEVALRGVEIRETAVGSRLLRWDNVEVKGIEAAVGPESLAVDTVDIHGAVAELVMSEDEQLNVLAVVKQVGGAEEGEGLPPLSIGTLTLHGCSGEYTDRTMAPPYTLALDEIEGTVSDVSSSSAAGARMDIAGAIRGGGAVSVEGEMDLFEPGRLTDLAIGIRQVAMPPLTPMSVRYLGYPVEKGKADVGLDYEVLDGKLHGENRFETRQLTLGKKVEGQGMVKLPIKLGISLLTDKKGRIRLDFPVDGDFNEPGFGLGGAFGAAAKEIMGEVIKSPFRLLAKLGGGKDADDYGYVEFEAGSAELGSNADEKLRALAAGAIERPALILRVAGVWEAGVDTPALQEAALDAAIDAAAAEAPESTTRLRLLEAMYPEHATLRAEHTGGDPPVLDETAYYRALREKLVAAQSVGETDLQALGARRAGAIRDLLVDEAGVDAARVQLLEGAAVKKPTGESWVRLPLEIGAGK